MHQNELGINDFQLFDRRRSLGIFSGTVHQEAMPVFCTSDPLLLNRDHTEIPGKFIGLFS